MNEEEFAVIYHKILDIFEQWAYERGHPAGQEEVRMIYNSLVHDFTPVFNMLTQKVQADRPQFKKFT